MYERAEYMLHREFVPREDEVVFDVGAYVGLYSLWASKLVGEQGFVVAFEPNPESYYWLKNNISLNRASNIYALPYALGDYIGVAKLYVPRINIEASSLIPQHIIRNPQGDLGILKSFNVPIITLDHFLAKANKLIGRRVESIDILKIDVEGYELKVLMGSREALSRGIINRLVIEVHIDQVKTQDLINFLNEYNYKAVGVKRFNQVKDMVYLKLSK